MDLIREAAHAGVGLIQIRERALDDHALMSLVRTAIRETAGTGARVIVNHRMDVALAAGAAGVHLRGDSVAASRIRIIAPRGFIIGRSVHAEDEAAAIEADGGCDYFTFGTVFPSTSKPPGHREAGIEKLRSVCARVRTPVLAIGGASLERMGEIARAGAAGVAAITLFMNAEGVLPIVRAIEQAFDT
jgi:thiamine-phosphate pyrophosphorylase